MKIERFIFGLFETNTYVVSDAQGNALLIDPACYRANEQEALERYLKDYHLQAILATHGHLDHLWGAKWASEQWSLPVTIHALDVPMVEAMQQQYDLFGIQRKAEAFPVVSFKMSEDGWVQAGAFRFQVLHTPGHTPGSVCLYWPEERVLLSGDTLFRMGFGRTDLPGGNYGQLITSLERLFALPAETKVYPGHGESTTISQEARY